MSARQEKRSSYWYVPRDMAFLFLLFGFLLLSLLISLDIAMTRSPWDSFFFRLTVILGGVGSILLFCARIPLYRQRRFFTVGPKELHGVYRKLYFAAYTCIVPSMVLLSLMLLATLPRV
jgi:hypothetical protein